MALRASIASGNFTTAATWGLVDSTSYLGAETGSEVLTTAGSGTRSSAFTPGAITVSHIGVKLSVRTGTTGTMSVHLILSSDNSEVAGTLVTINTADLPVAATADLNGGWHFFKLSSPVTLTGATAYKLEAWTSSSTQISLFRDSTADNISRALITTTTGAPAAGDDLIIAGEYTGAGTSNSFTVTMDNTATTDFGSAPTAANSLLTPGIAICNKGTLTFGTSAATNYYLKQSNSLIVYSGGTLNIGTTGTAIPRDSTANLQFDCGAAGDYGLLIRNLGTFSHQGLSRSSGKNIYYCLLNTDEAANSTSLGVDTDTGWLDNDVIAVASTTRTASQCESGTLNGNAGASTLTVDGFAGAGGGLANAHGGTSPVQAEVVLLTRNTNIYGASSTLTTYIYFAPTATINCDWAGYYWIGINSSGKYGIEIATTAGTCSINYCSLYNCTVSNNRGFYVSSASGSNIDISYNCIYNVVNGIYNSTTTGSHTYNYNIILLMSNGIYLAYSYMNVNYNRISGASTAALRHNGASRLLTYSNNILHSSSYGLYIVSQLLSGTVSDLTIYRCSSGASSSASCNISLNNLILFGNLNNIQWSSYANNTIFNNLICNGDSSFSSATGVITGGIAKFINCDFSTVSGIKTQNSYDFSVQQDSYNSITIINTKFNASVSELQNQSFMLSNSYISSQKHNQSAGTHKTWKREGTLTIEGTTTQAGSYSLKMTPINASEKLESSGANGGFKVAVANGQTCAPTVYVYEDGSYNGNRARLILKRNDALGVTSDTVLDTATASSDGAWEALTGTTAAVTDNGVLEFVVDCDGTAGNLFVDTFSATVA